MQVIRKIDHILARVEGILIALILSLMILLSFGQVILRNLFNDGILWGDTFLRQTVLWVGFLGASLAAREKRHISIDFLSHFIPVAWEKALKTLIFALTGLISGVLAWAAWTFVRFEQEGGSTLFLNYPVWIFQVILPYSFMIIAIRFLLSPLLYSSKAD